MAFSDIDDAQSALVFSVWDSGLDNGSGGWKTITEDNTEVQTTQGVLTVNKDGSYAYQANPGASGADVVKLKISDGVNETGAA